MREIEEPKSGLVDDDQPPRLRVEFPACMCSAMDVAHHHMGNGNTIIAHDKLGEAFQKFTNVSMSSGPMKLPAKITDESGRLTDPEEVIDQASECSHPVDKRYYDTRLVTHCGDCDMLVDAD